MSEDDMLKCLIAFVLGFLVHRMMRGNGLSVGGKNFKKQDRKREHWRDKQDRKRERRRERQNRKNEDINLGSNSPCQYDSYIVGTSSTGQASRMVTNSSGIQKEIQFKDDSRNSMFGITDCEDIKIDPNPDPNDQITDGEAEQLCEKICVKPFCCHEHNCKVKKNGPGDYDCKK